VNGTGLTTEPGGAFCDPSTMMRSPAFNPLATITLVPTVRGFDVSVQLYFRH
jgi:hypothetical protein